MTKALKVSESERGNQFFIVEFCVYFLGERRK